MFQEMIKKLINRFGYEIYPLKVKGYEYLFDKPRFQEMNVDLLGKKFQIADSLSFYYSYQYIFIQELYKFKTELTNPFIIDGGSNYGLSILYFKKLYPKSRIIGFESDPKIFQILKNNIDTYGLNNTEIYNYALWNEETILPFKVDNADGGRIQQRAENGDMIQVKTKKLRDYIKEFSVDFLKLNIEGAELNVIQDIEDFLKNIKFLFIEFHSFPDRPQELDFLLKTLKESGFRYQIRELHGSLYPFLKPKILSGMDMILAVFAVNKWIE